MHHRGFTALFLAQVLLVPLTATFAGAAEPWLRAGTRMFLARIPAAP